MTRALEAGAGPLDHAAGVRADRAHAREPARGAHDIDLLAARLEHEATTDLGELGVRGDRHAQIAAAHRGDALGRPTTAATRRGETTGTDRLQHDPSRASVHPSTLPEVDRPGRACSARSEVLVMAVRRNTVVNRRPRGTCLQLRERGGAHQAHVRGVAHGSGWGATTPLPIPATNVAASADARSSRADVARRGAPRRSHDEPRRVRDRLRPRCAPRWCASRGGRDLLPAFRSRLTASLLPPSLRRPCPRRRSRCARYRFWRDRISRRTRRDLFRRIVPD